MTQALPTPASTYFTGGTITQAQFKSALTQLIDGYLPGLLGADGTVATALSTLGAAQATGLTTEEAARAAGDANLQNQINNLPGTIGRPYNLRGTWVTGTAYAVSDAVIDPNNSMLYVCYVALTSTTAPDADSAHWYLAQGVSFAQLAATNGASYIGTVGGPTLATAKLELWVNPASGNDSNPGTEVSPFATVTAAAAKAAPGTVIRLAPGAVITENGAGTSANCGFIMPAGLTGVSILGDPGAPATFLGLQKITGATWTLSSGLTNTYQTVLNHTWIEPAQRGYPILIDGTSALGLGQRLQLIDWGYGAGAPAGVTNLATAQAYVDAHPGTFTVAGSGSYSAGYSAGSYTYYVHPVDTTNPGTNGRTYRFGQRQAPIMGTGNSLENVNVIGGVEHDGITALQCRFRNIEIIFPGNHGVEWPACQSENVTISGGNTWSPTCFAFHHFGGSAWDYAYHRNARISNWTGQFLSAIGSHGTSGASPTGQGILFDGLQLDNVQSVIGDCENIVVGVHIKRPDFRGLQGIGLPFCDFYIEGYGDECIIHLAAGSLAAPGATGLTGTIADCQIVFETGVMVQVAGGGALIVNRSKLVQKRPNVNNRWAQFSANCDGVTLNDCMLAAPISNQASNALVASSSGGASATVLQMNRCVYDGITPISTWLPSGVININADPLLEESGELGIRIRDQDSPYHWRGVQGIGMAVAPSLVGATSAMFNLTSGGIYNPAVSLATAQPVFALSSFFTGIRFLMDSSGGQYYAAFGPGGAFCRTAVAVGAWSTIASGVTDNFTCMASSTSTTGSYGCIIGADDGARYLYQPLGPDTFTALTAASAGLFGAVWISGAGGAGSHIMAGNGFIDVSTNTGTSFSTTTTAGSVWAAAAGSGTNAIVVGASGKIAYTTNSGTSWTVLTLDWPINFTSVAYDPTTGLILMAGKPTVGRVAAYQATFTSLATGITGVTQVGTPISNIAACAYNHNDQYGNGNASVWMITGPAYRPYYSRDLTTWWPDNPPQPAYSMATRTYIEQHLLDSLFGVM